MLLCLRSFGTIQSVNQRNCIWIRGVSIIHSSSLIRCLTHSLIFRILHIRSSHFALQTVRARNGLFVNCKRSAIHACVCVQGIFFEMNKKNIIDGEDEIKKM